MATSMYNHHRFARAVMKKFRKAPASLTIELHSEHWLFLGQQGKLEYNGPMRPFLVALREQAIPASLLNTILNATTTYVPIYDGCLLVEIHDYRTSCLTPAQELANQASGSDIYQRNPFHKRHHPAAAAAATAAAAGKSRHPPLNSRPAPTAAMGMSGLPCSTATIHRTGPQTNGTAALHTGLQASSEDSSCTKYRVVMKPDSVSMWEQLVHLNQLHGSEGGWDDQSVLQMESRILAAIAPPLALDTSFALSRTANLAMALTGPTLPHMAWDGTFIPRRERHAVQDGAINAKQVRPAAAAADPPSSAEASVAAKRPATTTTEEPSRGDAAKLGYAQREIEAFAKMGAPSVEDLSDRARASREEKASSPMSVWNWLSRTYGYHKLRRPGQEPPSNTIFTGQNTRASGVGAVNGDGAAAAMMAIANERANGQQAADDAGAGAGAAGTAAGKKKPTKKKKKDAAADESGRGANAAADVKHEDAAGDSSRGAKAKSKKKKDGAPATATATFAAVAPKGKKRGADEMSEAGSVAAPPPPPSPSQPPRPAAGSTDPNKKPVIASSASAPGKKLSKKQQRALEAAEREAARQQAAAAEPPKKKAKKSTFATTLPTAPSSSLALATPSIPPAGLADVPPPVNAVPPPDQLGNYDAPVDLSGEDYNQVVNANLLDPALPPDLAAMPIGEVPENIFMAAAADVDFAFPFAGMGGAEGEMDASGSAPAGMDFGGLGNPDEANLALAMLQQAQMPDQSRAPPGA
ncbi:hypothetical protein NliqN6_1984 [Naganishia liquefaciens]|uniref:Spt20-like SEP domain-containing protein n=1 Tax=Naganishia liquefaciens TaxID=104408 RepID=A0A8H3TQY6_9TREE|nr:hypothetical protein NliqN6_1984 [Naganishia liquefaciens]